MAPMQSLINLDVLSTKIVECCKDQKCSRYIQKLLCSPCVDKNSKMRFLDKLLGDGKSGTKTSNFEQLVLDSFGNYVVQIIL